MSQPANDLWDEAQRLPLEPCADCHLGQTVTRPYGPCNYCGGTGQVRSLLYEAIEMAETVPCSCHGCDYGGSTDPLRHEFSESCTCCRDTCGGTGRVPREQLGVVACPGPTSMPSGRQRGCDGPPCPVCHGSGTVPDPSEAGVRARLQECGVLRPVLDALAAANPRLDATGKILQAQYGGVRWLMGERGPGKRLLIPMPR